MTMKRLLAATVMLVALSACQRSAPEAVIVTNNTVEIAVEPPPVDATAAAVPANATNVVAAAPPPAFEDSEQMRDDADATGLTARLPDGEPTPGDGGNETRPAQ